ncbi:MAG: hypothetical protein LBF83_09045, partial [Spirochaetaceae bacterium]|nr:hypothetical protein [Spirochaetaceae bacterium]
LTANSTLLVRTARKAEARKPPACLRRRLAFFHAPMQACGLHRSLRRATRLDNREAVVSANSYLLVKPIAEARNPLSFTLSG